MYFFIVSTLIAVFFLVVYVAYIGRQKKVFIDPIEDTSLTVEEKLSREKCVEGLLQIITNTGNYESWSFIHEKAEFEDPTIWVKGKDEIKGFITTTHVMLKYESYHTLKKIMQRDQAYIYLTTKWKLFGKFPIEYNLRMRIFFTGQKRLKVIRYTDEWNGEYSNENPRINPFFRIMIRMGKRFLGILTASLKVNKEIIYA